MPVAVAVALVGCVENLSHQMDPRRSDCGLGRWNITCRTLVKVRHPQVVELGMHVAAIYCTEEVVVLVSWQKVQAADVPLMMMVTVAMATATGSKRG